MAQHDQESESATATGDDGDGNNADDSDPGQEGHQAPDPDHIEGLGRVLTGINAALSRNVVSSTMAHLLICQGGSRFTYSHDFANLLLTQLEDVLEGKEVHFILRRNKAKDGEVIQWADSSADDYIMRPDELKNNCFYDMTMNYEKKFKTFEQMRKEEENAAGGERDAESKKRLEFFCEHPGKDYSYMTKLKHPVIPKISMRAGMICDIEQLEIRNDNPRADVKLSRENYAKYAMMLFYPFTELNDLKLNGSYWAKFVAVGGTQEDDPVPRGEKKHFWPPGKQILHNMQTRATVEKSMKRPPDPVVIGSETPESTGARKKAGHDQADAFDVDIDVFDGDDMDPNFNPADFQPLEQQHPRSHAHLINRAYIPPSNLVSAHLSASDTLILEGKSRPERKTGRGGSTRNTNDKDGGSAQGPKRDYATILSFIEGSLVGMSESQDAGDDSDSDRDSNTMGDNNGSYRGHIPTLDGVARSKSKQLDKKQYIAYDVICCSFLLQLVRDGGNDSTDLGGYLNTTLNCDSVNSRDKLIQKLKARGAKDQLIMLLSGPAGCGKSTSVSLAQQYCHNFCMAVAVAFNDITFYFTATTGSAAALFGGMTIHSAAHLNKTNITDALRREWEDVRILIIDEISFFKVEDIQKLDRQLKKLTGRYDAPYGGVSIVFSGDFHQLQPVCKTDEILYSGSAGATAWENTINCAIFLENSHRFKDDPEYGEILGRMRMGKDTREDREKINTRVIGTNDVELPTDPNACYACPINKERNSITAGVYKNHILATHPTIDSDELPPHNTLNIEAAWRR